MAYLTVEDCSSGFNNPEYVAAALERIRARTTVTPQGCHECSLALNDKGYSTIWFHDRMWRTHRLRWFIEKGEVPSDLVLDHLCRNPKCCNPEHLEVVSHTENTARGDLPKIGKPILSSCKKGHPASEYVRSDRARCRQCNRERMAEKRKANG